MAVKRFTDVGQQATREPSRLCRARCEAAEKEEKEIHSSTRESVKLPEPVLPTAGFCPADTEMRNHRRKQLFHL